MIFSWLNKGTRLDEHLQDDTKNNFLLVRFLAALIVVRQHSIGIAPKTAGDFSLLSFLKLSTLSLPSFFVISGILISQSLEKSSSWKNFLWKRFLRLYPAAWLSILFCALILGPILTTCSIKEYFSSSTVYEFLSSIFLVRIKYYLPGVFQHSVMGTSSINASLWSLCLELKLYIGLLTFWLLKIPGKKIILISIMILMLIAGQFFPDETDIFLFSVFGRHLSIFGEFTGTVLFLSGVLIYFYRHKIIIKNYWLVFIIILLILLDNFSNLSLLVFVFVIIVNLFAATKGVDFLRKFTPKADLSYGIYAFAYPLQQVIANYFHPKNTLTFFALSVFAVLPFALFSWHFVEKKALSLKYLIR